MKTKYWIGIHALLLIICLGLSLWLMGTSTSATHVQVRSEGKLLYTLVLAEDREVTVTTDRGSNVITVKEGKVAVTAASCPDHHCMKRGFCSGGAQIVCLPNRLVLSFTAEQDVDAVIG